MIKLLATDVDGTLVVPGESSVSLENINAIKQLQKQGVIIVIATGRIYQGIKQIIKDLKLDEYESYAICNNGAQIYDLKHGKEIYTRTLEEKYLYELDDFLQGKASYLLNQKDYGIMSSYSPLGIQHDHDAIDLDFIWPQKIERYFKCPTYRMTVTTEEKALRQIEQQLKEKYEHELTFANNGGFFLDITHKEADKGIALDYLCQILSIKLNEVIAAGDGGNDLLMLQKAGVGLLMNNALPAVRQAHGEVSDIKVEHHVIHQIMKRYF